MVNKREKLPKNHMDIFRSSLTTRAKRSKAEKRYSKIEKTAYFEQLLVRSIGYNLAKTINSVVQAAEKSIKVEQTGNGLALMRNKRPTFRHN